MIKRFGFKNFSSFREGAEISFMFDGNTPVDISQGRNIGTVLGIKGANGSGKTSIIKALSFISQLCSSGFRDESKEGLKRNKKTLPLDTFFHNEEPTEFYIEFVVGDIEYYYELDIYGGIISREALWKKIKTKRRVFERINNSIEHCISSLKELHHIELKSDTSVIHLVELYKFKSDMQELVDAFMFFVRMIINVSYNGYCDFDMDVSDNSKSFLKNRKLFAFATELMKVSDSSITKVEIVKALNNDGDEIFYPLFVHKHSGKEYKISYGKESSGTRKIFDIIGAYYLVLTDGGVLALDEFDIHLHAAVLPKIIELFNNLKINIHDAQFIFTSHNTEIIDDLGKYRTILVNKDDSESYCYRLDEIPGTMIRNDRPITQLYIDGKIGGIPVFSKSRIEKIMKDLEDDQAI